MERFDIVDANGLPTGETVDRETAHRGGIRHRTAHVWIARKRNGIDEILLQKRSMNKDSFPGRLDTSSAGHIPAGSEPLESALRELSEELGVTAMPEELQYIGSFDIAYEKEFYGRLFKDNEISHVYLLRRDLKDEEITVQEEELESVEWHTYDEVAEAVARHDRAYCVPSGGLELLGKALKG